jgi:hypothetical protein
MYSWYQRPLHPPLSPLFPCPTFPPCAIIVEPTSILFIFVVRLHNKTDPCLLINMHACVRCTHCVVARLTRVRGSSENKMSSMKHCDDPRSTRADRKLVDQVSDPRPPLHNQAESFNLLHCTRTYELQRSMNQTNSTNTFEIKRWLANTSERSLWMQAMLQGV